MLELDLVHLVIDMSLKKKRNGIFISEAKKDSEDDTIHTSSSTITWSSGSSQIDSFSNSKYKLDDIDYENQIFEVLINLPETNPDGTIWKMTVGDKTYSKKDIIKNWTIDDKMRNNIKKMLLNIKFHKLRRS